MAFPQFSLDRVGAVVNAAWRPFTGFLFSISLAFALFNPAVTESKMLVAAGVLTALGYLRSKDKEVIAKANAAVGVAQAQGPQADAS